MFYARSYIMDRDTKVSDDVFKKGVLSERKSLKPIKGLDKGDGLNI